MSTYFDEIDAEVGRIASFVRDDEAFLVGVEEIEERMVREVTLCTGDREFPDDLREAMLSAIAVYEVRTRVPGVPTKGREFSTALRLSWLTRELHSLFHALAKRRVTTRFGVMLDSPSDILRMRDAYEKGETL